LKKGFFKRLVESGVKEGDSPSSRQSIIFSNSISLVLVLASICLFVIIPQNHNVGAFRRSFISAAIFSVPILLNWFSLVNLSRFYLCWMPPILVTWSMITSMKLVTPIPVSFYDGLRIYLIATSCIPYLLMDRRNLLVFILAILPNLLLLVFCDSILDEAGVGYATQGVPDVRYGFTTFRSIISYVVIGGCCLALRLIIDQTEKINQQLITELEKKSAIIKEQADSEVFKLNQQLIANIKEISKREFTLQRSQEIAKVGSWEFNAQQRSVYWSDEMYDIFGLDKSIDLNSPQLTSQLFGDSALLINQAHDEVIKSSKAYDFTLQTKTPLGYVKWVRVVGFPLYSNLEVVGISGIVHDITVFKESEERIRENERNYRSLFEQASDAIVVTDFKGRITDINTSMCKLLGYSREELLQLSTDDIIDPEQLNENPIQFDKLMMGEHFFNERRAVRKDRSMVYVEVNVKMFSEGKIMAIARDITDRKATELEKEKVRYDLNERVKEITSLYRVSQILQAEGRPLHETLQGIVNLLPSAWQYPSISAAKICIAEAEFVSSNFGEYKHRQVSEFTTRNGLHGTVEVVYLEDRPIHDEGPFLKEERDLINMMANMIQIHLSRRYENEALRRTEANQSATINNTNFLIWSVNRDYELISFNKQFAAFSLKRFGIEVKVGTRLEDDREDMREVRNTWVARYNRALTGETFKVVSTVGDQKFEFSLNPIIEENKVIGVSVFGEDITDRLRYEEEMRAANKQIGELHLRALRSAMNPHFIFNSLNSIQYYIMEKDTRSAITYLSTFSKLIRAILSNSIKDRVRLADELEMIKHYIQLEAMRFDNKFDSIINVDEQVDIENTEIPSMLVQPYVENAILHGLYNKPERGLLKLSVSSDNGMILFDVEDNGVGRLAAGQLKLANLSKHKSMGTALTEERLKLINNGGGATVEIIDLEADGRPAGTKVKLWVTV
jgi:PAS domain S-box-containing protein